MSTAGRRGGRIPWVTVTAVLGVVGVVAGIVVLLQLLADDEGVPRNSPVPATADSLATGALLYESNCLVCHGPRGEGSALAADLTFHIPFRSDRAMFVRIRDGFPTDSAAKTMPAFNNVLTDTESWHIVNFLRNAFGEATFEPVLPEDLP